MAEARPESSESSTPVDAERVRRELRIHGCIDLFHAFMEDWTNDADGLGLDGLYGVLAQRGVRASRDEIFALIKLEEQNLVAEASAADRAGIDAVAENYGALSVAPNPLEFLVNLVAFDGYLSDSMHRVGQHGVAKRWPEADWDELVDALHRELEARSMENRSTRLEGKDIHPLKQPCGTLVGDGIAFEHWLQLLFEAQGWRVSTTPASNDHGADLVLDKPGRRIVVQAKAYAKPVGNSAIQEIVAAKAHYGAKEGWVCSTSTFTRSAEVLGHSNDVRLLNATALDAARLFV